MDFRSTTRTFARKYSKEMSAEGKNINQYNEPRLDPGMTADFMCSAFEGDRKDLNMANTHELNKNVADFFSGISSQIQNFFSKSFAIQSSIVRLSLCWLASPKITPGSKLLYGTFRMKIRLTLEA
jgi:hypothetical protein